MALRDQPYLPLYVDDFTTDEKLMECSASATGVYIRLMCLFHKQEFYGKILLKQKFKQSTEQINNFACQVAIHFPYTVDIIIAGLTELILEKVLTIEGDFLIQGRMVKDNELSLIREIAGRKGGKRTQKNSKKFAYDFAKANIEANNQANAVIGIVNENVSDIDLKERERENELLSNQRWHEQNCMSLSIEFEQMKKLLIEFINLEKAKQQFLSESLKRTQAHFVSWARIEITKQKNGTKRIDPHHIGKQDYSVKL